MTTPNIFTDEAAWLEKAEDAQPTAKRTPEYSYDSACEHLAAYFLGTPARDEEVWALAQHIQDAVEDWLETNPVRTLLTISQIGCRIGDQCRAALARASDEDAI